MKTSLKSSLNVILSHKDYFDQRLLDIVSYLQNENNKLIVSLDMKKAQILKLNDDILKLKNLNAKLTYENHSLTLSKKESNKNVADLEEALKKMQEELNRLTIENKKAIEEVNRQRKIQDELIKKIKKLENTNSTNSNMPSSTNILTHSIKPSNSRKESNRKRGGQIGHPVFRPHMSTCVDEIRNLYVKKAPSGSRALKDKTGNILYYYSQEIDLLIKPKVIETRYYISEDGVEILNEEKKKYKISPVIYSNHFKSTMIYLNQRGTIPYERLSEMIKELSNNSINIKPSTMVKWSYDFSKKSEERTYEILKEIKEKKVINVDETGLKINKDQNWMHTIANEAGVFYTVTKNRSDKENGPIALLADYTNILVHDHFKPYYSLTCKHSECNAHIERYLQEGIDFENNASCKEVKEILQKALHKRHELEKAGIEKMESKEIEEIKASLLKIIKEELDRYSNENPNITKKLESNYIKLFRRMSEYIEEHLLFLRDFDVPYTNNMAERSCRKIKAKKNISYQFVSKDGAESYARAMTIIETARQNKENVLSAIENIIK